MQLENSEEFLEKKLVELKTLLASDHPNIVGFYGAFYNDGTLSFVLVPSTLFDSSALHYPTIGRIYLSC